MLGLEAMESNKIHKLKFCECGCKEKITRFRSDGKPHRFKPGHWIRTQDFTGINNSRYNFGKRTDNNGYIDRRNPKHHFAKKDGGYVAEHRLVWEEENYASLLPWADVHHKDGNKKNNVWYNLRAMTKSQHTSIHSKKDMSNRFCFNCNTTTTLLARKKNGTLFYRWFRHPKTKQEWLCNICYCKIYKKSH